MILLIPKHSLKYNSPPIFPVDKFEKIEGVKGRPFSDGFMETFFFIKDRDPPLKASRIVKMGFCLFLYVILTALSETSEKSTIQLFMSKSQFRT